MDKSLLEPTMTQAILGRPQKFRILSYTPCIMLKEFLDVMEYTSI